MKHSDLGDIVASGRASPAEWNEYWSAHADELERQRKEGGAPEKVSVESPRREREVAAGQESAWFSRSGRPFLSDESFDSVGYRPWHPQLVLCALPCVAG